MPPFAMPFAPPGLHSSPPGGGVAAYATSWAEDSDSGSDLENPCSPPVVSHGLEPGRSGIGSDITDLGARRPRHHHHYRQISLLDALSSAMRKSLVMCSVGAAGEGGGDGGAICPSIVAAMNIGWPTDVRHVAHVTFDRFDGYLGLPDEMRTDVPTRAPSASASIFGVSVNSLHCSYDSRGNSVPTILLVMQKHLYSQGGLQVEGIFRINPENSEESHVRQNLNSGIVPHEIDTHCLAGLIKAWFRELPTGVLDSISPDEMMQCNTEKECSRLVRTLPPTEGGLLDWAINLMADVVELEHRNRMNARNIAMVFAPNMTQMADPLTALVHAVQVMNFLKTLVMRTLREREELSLAESKESNPSGGSPGNVDGSGSLYAAGTHTERSDSYGFDRVSIGRYTSNGGSSRAIESSCIGEEPIRDDETGDTIVLLKCSTPPSGGDDHGDEDDDDDGEALWYKLNIRRRVKPLCRHPVLHLSGTKRKLISEPIVMASRTGGEGSPACAS